MQSRTLILSAHQIQQRIDRIAYQIYECNYQEKEVYIAGIANNGYHLAERIVERVKRISPIQVKLLKIKMNKKHPLSDKINITYSTGKEVKEQDLKEKVVIVVDDVLDSGRTMMYGIEPFLKYYVKSLKTVVLINRAHHSYPIRANYIGVSMATTMQDHVEVELNGGKNDAVYLL